MGSFFSCCLGDRCCPPYPQLRSRQCGVAGEKCHLPAALLHLLHVGQFGPLPVLCAPAPPQVGLFLLAAPGHPQSQNRGPYGIWQQVKWDSWNRQSPELARDIKTGGTFSVWCSIWRCSPRTQTASTPARRWCGRSLRKPSSQQLAWSPTPRCWGTTSTGVWPSSSSTTSCTWNCGAASPRFWLVSELPFPLWCTELRVQILIVCFRPMNSTELFMKRSGPSKSSRRLPKRLWRTIQTFLGLVSSFLHTGMSFALSTKLLAKCVCGWKKLFFLTPPRK